jgi:membrane protein
MSDNEKSRRRAGAAARAAEFLLAVARRFREDRSIQTAGSLTFTMLLSIVPVITVVVALSTAFPVFDAAMKALETYLVKNILPDATGVQTITGHVASFARRAGRLTGIGLVALAVTSIMLMITIDEALNRIFRVQRRRPLAYRLLMYWAVLTLGPLLIGGSLWITSYLVGRSLDALRADWLTLAVLRLVAFAFTCAALTMLYTVVPNRRIAVRHALAGGVVAAVLFELAKRGFALYIANFPSYALIYGAFAAVPIFLVWAYLSWLVVLLGATITALAPVYRFVETERRRVAGRDLFDALAILAALARAQAGGRVRGLTRLAVQTRLLPYRCERVLERCAVLGWAARTDREGWLLARDAGSIRVADVFRAFALDPLLGENRGAALEALGAGLAAHERHVDEDFALTVADVAALGTDERAIKGRPV